MKLGIYKAIDQATSRRFFLDYIDSLRMPIIDYVAIGIQDTINKTSTSIMSRHEWQNIFKSQNLAEHDPIRKASFNTKSSIFAFDEIDYHDSPGKEVMRLRKLYEIENGIVLIRRNLGHNYMLTLGTGFKNFEPYTYFLDNKNAVNMIFNDLITLITDSSKREGFTVKHPCGVAR